MKKKYLTETILKGVDDYDIKIIQNKEEFIVIKYIKSIDTPFIGTHTGQNICLLDVGYYMVEYMPINENYCVRVFIDRNKEVVEYYLDVIKENGIEDGKPYYYDLYLDITIDTKVDNYLTIWDKDELQHALDIGIISNQDFELAHNVLNMLLEEIANNSNKYINMNHKDIIEKYL